MEPIVDPMVLFGESRDKTMAARILWLSASLLAATVGACGQAPDQDGSEANAGASPSATYTESGQNRATVADVPLDIVISQFPGGYQSRWALNAAACAGDPETSAEIMSLQGRLVKFNENIGTMIQGKRTTSKTMEAEFEFESQGNKTTKSMAFELSEDRQKLVRTDVENLMKTRYVRCPKLMAG